MIEFIVIQVHVLIKVHSDMGMLDSFCNFICHNVSLVTQTLSNTRRILKKVLFQATSSTLCCCAQVDLVIIVIFWESYLFEPYKSLTDFLL